MKEKSLVRWAQTSTGRVPAALFGENRCNRSSSGVASADGVPSEVRDGVHPGKIGSQNPQRIRDGDSPTYRRRRGSGSTAIASGGYGPIGQNPSRRIAKKKEKPRWLLHPTV